MEIAEVYEITEELVAAFERLIPQLSSGKKPSREEIARIVNSPATALYIARDPERQGEIVGTLILAMYQVPTGLKAWNGFVNEAYNSALYWPSCASLYSRIRTSMPEMVMVARAFNAWGRSASPIVDLPEDPSDDDKAYQEFILSDFENMEGGFGALVETMVDVDL